MNLYIIHLSDIHIKNENNIIVDRVNELCRACSSVIQSDSEVIITISGDIAFSGFEQQYKIAETIINELSEYLKKEKNSTVFTVFVPGNHDCDFNEEKSIRKTLIENMKPNNVDQEYYNAVSCVQKNYIEFASKFDIDASKILSRKEFQVGDNKILFLLANTAWMSVLKENPGKIIMPTSLFDTVDPKEFKVVFYLFHHPTNWLNPDYKNDFIDHIRNNADIVLIGHEHARDRYQQFNDHFSVFCNQGKELQDSSSSESAFSVIAFDNVFQLYKIYDFEWSDNKYNRINETPNQFHKNTASLYSVTQPNNETSEYLNDIGITVNHFAKDDVFLSDLYVWPYLNKLDYSDENKRAVQIKSSIPDTLFTNSLSIVVGASSSGKTSLAKMIYANGVSDDKCYLLIDGNKFTSSGEYNITTVIEQSFINQYSGHYLEDFRHLEKEKRRIIVDNFDCISTAKNRRCDVLNYLTDNFDKVVILMTSSIDITSILSSKSISNLSDIYYYDILPFGNKKRKELISKWYHLGEENLSEDQLDKKIDNSIRQIDIMLGNGSSFVPAYPVFVIGALQNNDAIKPSYENSKYAVLYESLILNSLSRVSADYVASGDYNIDVNIMSRLAYQMLKNKQTSFNESDLINTVRYFEEEKLFHLSYQDILQKMISAQIVFHDATEGNVYKFKYPYIFYYFTGIYIAYNIDNDPDIRKLLEYMSTKLYNETYGNIILFVCHFSKSKEIIDNILLNAYSTLDKYAPFDFTKTNPIFEEIQDAVIALIPKSVGDNSSVSLNKNIMLENKDDIGINDGQVISIESEINDDISEKERDQELASVAAAFKTIEVLGQILQNYPGDIDRKYKTDMIDEIHKLGMRLIQPIINALGYLEEDLVEYIIERAKSQKKIVRRDEIIRSTKRFIKYLISVMARGMVHQVAISLNSKYILPAAEIVFSQDTSISSKLILMDLKLNCLNQPDYKEIHSLKKQFDKEKEVFASSILSSIVGYYLNYNKCDRTLRSKLCTLFEIQEKNVLIENQKKLST